MVDLCDVVDFDGCLVSGPDRLADGRTGITGEGFNRIAQIAPAAGVLVKLKAKLELLEITATAIENDTTITFSPGEDQRRIRRAGQAGAARHSIKRIFGTGLANMMNNKN